MTAIPVVRTMTTALDADGKHQPHPADYHAEITAEKIIMVAETASPEVVSASRDLRKKVEGILTKHHVGVALAEQTALAETGAVHAAMPIVANVNDTVLQDIVDASTGTILESHFARKDVQDVISTELHHETRSQMAVHRQVHAVNSKPH
jgi:hypothetical protein